MTNVKNHKKTSPLDIVMQQTENRRVKWAHDERIQLMQYKKAIENNHYKILTWIITHTSSDFYLGGSFIGFADPRDTTIFKLGWKP